MEQRPMEQPTNDLPKLRPIPWARTSLDTNNDPLLCLQTGSQHYCLLRDFTKQQTETDTKIHSQTLDRGQGVLWKYWGKD